MFGRIPAVSHAIVPDYLRTKLDLEIEQKIHVLEQKAVAMTMEQYQKQVATYTKVVAQVTYQPGGASLFF